MASLARCAPRTPEKGCVKASLDMSPFITVHQLEEQLLELLYNIFRTIRADTFITGGDVSTGKK